MIDEPMSAPPGWKDAPLGEFAETMWHNTWASFHNYNSAALHLAEIDALFGLALEGMVDPDHRLPALLMIRCSSALRVASILALSVPTEAYAVLRSALEYAGYSFLMSREPALCEVWLERDTSRKDEQAVRSAFTHGASKRALEAENRNLAANFSRLYETTIQLGAHPNEKALTNSLRIVENPDGRSHTYQVVMLPDGGLPVLAAIRLCALAGLTIISIYKMILPEQFVLLEERIEAARAGMVDPASERI